MIRYKGFNIWYNSLQSGYMLQSGYDIIGVYKTESAAKSVATKLFNKGE